MNAQPFINEEHGYYRISKDNISLLIDNYCQELGDNFIVYIDKDNDFDNFCNVTELITSVLEQKQLEYKIGDMPIDRCIEWLIPEPLNNKDIYCHRYIQIYWYSSENQNPLQFKGKKAANILMSDSLFNDSNFLLWVSSVNTHYFRNFKFKTGFKEIDDKERVDQMSFSDTGVHDAARLKELQALPLDRKISITQARIIEWYNAYEGNVYVSLSGGKDSTVLLHLVRQLFPDVPAVFSNTGLEYPEIQKFAKSFDNVTTVTPKMNFVNVIRTYGYPIISKEVANAIYYARRIRPYNTFSDGGAGQQSENRKNSSACEQTRGGRERVNGRSSNCLESDLKTDKNIGQPPPPREQLNSKQGRIKKQNQREFSERSASWDSG